MPIELIEVEDMKTGRGGGKKGGKYQKYIVASKKLVPFLKEAIEQKGTIRVKNKVIAQELGKEFEVRNPTSIYWGMKYAMFHQGIVVGTGKHNDGSDVLVLRNRTPDDVLPASLAKGEIPDEDNGEDGDNGDGEPGETESGEETDKEEKTEGE